MLKVNNLYHSYDKGKNFAVSDVTFAIEAGQIFGLLGPNGAGKTTTQNVLTGLLPLQKGDASISGIDVSKPTAPMFNRIGVLFEQPNLYKKMTGLENLAFYRRMYGADTEDPNHLLTIVGLTDAANKRVGEYSKGMLQKLMFARSLINKPEMWFLDEPLTGLDPATSNQLKELILEKKKAGTAIFLTTHNMHIADELCDTVAFMNEGSILLSDSPRNLKLSYGKRLVNVEYSIDGNKRTEMLSLVDEEEKMRLKRLIDEVEIETMHSQEATLEDVFIKVTGRGLK